MLTNVFNTTIYTSVIEEKENNLFMSLYFITLLLVIVFKIYILLIILVICLIPIIILGIWAYFIFEKLFVEGEGNMKIKQDSIIFNETTIQWDNIKKIKIDLVDYEKKRIYRGKGDNRPRLSLGLKNKIYLETKDNEVFDYYFKIHSKDELKFLEQFFWTIVKSNPFTLENAKEIVKPKNYQEHQILKDIINKNLKT
jgi:hypothetical protein